MLKENLLQFGLDTRKKKVRTSLTASESLTCWRIRRRSTGGLTSGKGFVLRKQLEALGEVVKLGVREDEDGGAAKFSGAKQESKEEKQCKTTKQL